MKRKLEQENTPNKKQATSTHLLYEAIAQCDLPLIETITKQLFEQDSDIIKFENNDGETLLHTVIDMRDTSTAKFLLDNGANIEARDNYKDTPLHFAAGNDDAETVKFLLDNGADIEAKNIYENTALLLAVAVANYSTKIVALLLEAGANINAVNADGNTALHLAATYGFTEIIDLLLAKGENINAVNADGNTALHLAAENRYEDTVKFLLEAGAAIHTANLYGKTSIHLAATKGYTEIVKLFLLLDASINICTNSTYQNDINDLIDIYNDVKKIITNQKVANFDHDYVKCNENNINFATECFLVKLKSAKSINKVAVDNILSSSLLNQQENSNLKIALASGIEKAKKDAIDFLALIEDEIIGQLFTDKKSQISIFYDEKAKQAKTPQDDLNKLLDDLNKLLIDEDSLINSLIDLFSVKEYGHNYIAKNIVLANYKIQNSKEEDILVADKAMQLMGANLLKFKDYLLPQPKLQIAFNNLVQEYEQFNNNNQLCYIFNLENQIDILRRENIFLENKYIKQQETLAGIEDFLKNLGYEANTSVDSSTKIDSHDFDNTSLAGDSLTATSSLDQVG